MFEDRAAHHRAVQSFYIFDKYTKHEEYALRSSLKEASVTKEQPIKVLILYGGDRNRKYNRTLQAQVRKFVAGAKSRGAVCEVVRLGDWPFVAQNARPTHRVRGPLRPLRKKITEADIIVHATVVHWGLPSVLTTLCIHQVEAPLEWGAPKKGKGWRTWGKTIVMITVSDDSGDSTVNAIVQERGQDRGLFPIGWGSHRKNKAMKRSENNYQNRPDVVARIAVEHAKRMRNFPQWGTFER